jgi:predicted dehydrogenase
VSTSVESVRLGFAGLGWIGFNRLQALANAPGVVVAALTDPDPTALARARDLAPGAKVVGSFESLLLEPLDGVVIATPSALHGEQARAALERSLAVFCQKPLGRNAAEARAIVETAERRDRLLGVDFSYRECEATQKLRGWVSSGELGDIFAVNLVFHNAYGPDKSWFYDPRLSGGGALMDLGIHLVDLALWVLDFPTPRNVTGRLFAQGQPLTAPGGEAGHERRVEDYVSAQIVLDGGTCVDLACSWRLHAGCDCVIEASFFGTRGGVSLRNVNGSFYDFTADALIGTSRRQLAAPPDAWGGRAACAWAAQLRASRGFDPAARRVIEVSEVLDAIYASSPATSTTSTSVAASSRSSEPLCAS